VNKSLDRTRFTRNKC